MATLIVDDIAPGGLVDTLVAASVSGDEFANEGSTFLEVNNGSGSTITVTFVTQKSIDGLAVADLAVAVAAGERRLCGPFRKGLYNVQSGTSAGRVQVTYSGVTSLTVGAHRLTPVIG